MSFVLFILAVAILGFIFKILIEPIVQQKRKGRISKEKLELYLKKIIKRSLEEEKEIIDLIVKTKEKSLMSTTNIQEIREGYNSILKNKINEILPEMNAKTEKLDSLAQRQMVKVSKLGDLSKMLYCEWLPPAHVLSQWQEQEIKERKFKL